MLDTKGHKPGKSATQAEPPRAARAKGAPAVGASKNPLWFQSATQVMPPAVGAAPALQKKLAVGREDDPLELQADHVADMVLRMPAPLVQRACACGGGNCPECRDDDPGRAKHGVQRKGEAGGGSPGGGEAPASVHKVVGAPGRPLDSGVRSFMEPRFGRDFSSVRVHDSPDAAESARSIQARAYTHDDTIVFAAGEYAPQTESGKHLIAHELTHVVQQAGTIQRDPDAPAPPTASTGSPSDAGVTTPPANADASTAQAPTASEEDKIVAIRKRLEGATASGLGKLLNWVGPLDEWDLEELWSSFEDRLPAVANAHIDLFSICVKRGMDLESLPGVRYLEWRFKDDVYTIARRNFAANKKLIEQEIKSYGLDDAELAANQPPDKEHFQLQEAFREVAKGQEVVKNLRRVVVGHELHFNTGRGGNVTTTVSRVLFDPNAQPQFPLTQEELAANEGRSWEEIYAQWKTASEAISGIANLHPAVYAGIVQGDMTGEDVAGKTADAAPDKLKAQFRSILDQATKRVEEAEANGPPAYQDLGEIHKQLLVGGAPGIKTNWSEPFYHLVAESLVGGEQAADERIRTAALVGSMVALFVVELATAGTATFFIAAGLGVGLAGTAAAMDWKKYNELNAARGAAASDATALVSKAAVEKKHIEAIESTIAFVTALLAVGMKGLSGLKQGKAPTAPDGEPGAAKSTPDETPAGPAKNRSGDPEEAAKKARTDPVHDKSTNAPEATPTKAPDAPAQAPTSVDPNEIRFSQNTVSSNKVDRVTGEAFNYDDLVASMRKSGWKGDPVDVVKMSDGKLTSMDNTRIRAARDAKINVQTTVRNGQDPLTPDQAARFTVKGKPPPTTWEEAINLRIGKQSGGFGKKNPFGSDEPPRLK